LSYKTVLLGLDGPAGDAHEDPTPLSYIEYRNQQALRAWRERAAKARATVPERRRSWLSAFRWADSAELIR